MKIAIVSATYTRGLSYQENVWAETLARLGHRVRVFTAAERSAPPEPQVVDGARFDLQEIESLCLPRGIYLTTALADPLLAFDPDAVFWIGAPHYFGRALFTDPRLADVPVVLFASVNHAMHPFDWWNAPRHLGALVRGLAFHLLRSPDVVLAMRRASLVVANTPETREILMYYPRRGREALERKLVTLPLGFAPNVFAFDPARRQAIRAAEGFAPDEVVAVVSSRFEPNKRRALEVSIDGVGAAMAGRDGLSAVLVGLTDSPTSADMRRRVAEQPHPERFRFEPFAGRERLRDLFHAADVAVFQMPSISCQEALGAGLYCLFPRDGALDHLITHPAQGRFVRRDDPAALAEALSETCELLRPAPERDARRRQAAAEARWLGYDRIAEEVLSRVGLT